MSLIYFRNMFKVLEISGNHYQVGLSLGEEFRGDMVNYLNILKENKDFEKFLELANEYIDITNKYLPNSIEKIKGMADGANIDFNSCFLLNTRELSDILDPGFSSLDGADKIDHCTVAVSFGKDGAIVGHNEDWAAESQDDLYILKENLNGLSSIALTYKGVLPGLGASMNHYGFVQCINEMYQNNVGVGIPKIIQADEIMHSESLTEAETKLREFNKSSGFNHVLVQNNEVKNIEIAGKEMEVMNTINEPYVHTNHYLSPKLVNLEKTHTVSSVHRFERAKELIKNHMGVAEMERLLSDREDIGYPISRPEETIGSVVMVPRKGEFFVCFGPAEVGKYDRFTI